MAQQHLCSFLLISPAGANSQSLGIGIEAVKARDYKSIILLAAQGDADAQFNLAFMHEAGKSVTQNYAEAAAWYRKAAEKGYADAQKNFAIMYYTGSGFSQNSIMAYILAILAAAQGNESAVKVRDIILETLAREQIAEAQNLAAEWSVGMSLPAIRDFKTGR
ncbi:MAG: sel1 repeat family protein [Pseudomonas sp.]|jgi:TPR repeat protein|nr:sel1 repeat family protein [Pseudomonas sp.]